MYVKKFEADTLDDALQSVKRELGPDAIILKTITNKGLKGAFKKSRVEITAAISEQTYEKKARVDHVLTHEQQDQFYNAPARTINNMINDYSGNHNTPARTQNTTTSAPSYGSMGLNKVVNTVSKASNKIKNSLDDFLSTEEAPARTQRANGSLDSFLSDEEVTPRMTNRQTPRQEAVEVEHTQNLEAQRRYEESQRETHEMSNEMKQHIKSQSYQIELLEQKLYELTQKVSAHKEEAEPKGVRGLRNSLRALDLSEKIIVDIIKKASFELNREELDDADLIYDFALREINSLVSVDMPLFSKAEVQDKPVVTILVSETSCGQASMAMKLAVLKEDVKIIQFRTTETKTSNTDFTKSMFDLDMVSVNTLSHLMTESRKAIAEGRSLILDLKLNFAEVDETKKFIETLRRSFENVEILTTISAINAEVYNRKILSKYNQFSNGVIISYVDQCLNFGSLVNLNHEFHEKPLKFFGTGPTVPDDIEAATCERILAGMFQLS